MRNACNVSAEYMKEKQCCKYVDVSGRIILKMNVKKLCMNLD
jgi:hypothetical protein